MSNKIEKAEDLAAVLRVSLPSGYDIASISTIAKIPFKVLSLREALLFRMSELSDATLKLYSNKHFVASCILARSAMETTALIFWLQSRISKVISEQSVGDIDDWLMRGLLGDREKTIIGLRDALSVISAIDKVDAVYSGFRKGYDFLSEFSHPNWAGTYGSYGTDDRKNLRIEFHTSSKRNEWTFIINYLIITLEIFTHHYNEIAPKRDEFIKICERELEKNT